MTEGKLFNEIISNLESVTGMDLKEDRAVRLWTLKLVDCVLDLMLEQKKQELMNITMDFTKKALEP